MTAKARQAARGKDCMIRIPFVCNGNPETTVLAHYRLLPYCGAGMKPPDKLGAWACSSCHDMVDGRKCSEVYDKKVLRLMHAEGVFRTWIETGCGE